MIKSFKHKGLRDLFAKGSSAKVDARMNDRILKRLEALDQATRPEDMNFPGWKFHSLSGFEPTRYTVHVNGPWCITFEFSEGDAEKVDLEQYH